MLNVPTGHRRVDWLAYAIPIILLAALQGIYLLWSDFYLKYVLEYRSRETQAVELLTVSSALVASLLLLGAARQLWRDDPANRGGAGIIALIALAAFFFGGEEASWGKSYLALAVPSLYDQVKVETNLHNNISMVQTAGSTFLIVMFFVLPIAWSQRSRWKLPPSWAPAIAEGPVIFGMAAAFSWKLYKSTYRAFILQEPEDADVFYVQFVDQINEQKEMLVAVSLLMYGLYRMAAVRRYLSNRPRNSDVV